MASLVPEYNYDIFISYRQKDNKHDGWVTEFVDNLKGELESTFKEDISVYFDINPHDGLLETHDVDESLKEKLKCLIFIPIVSRTYCDARSFAWVHEFKAFVEQASKDQYCLKIKLPNGNVASRVLPVIIHDLDPSDIKECESVLGGVLRGIEFIYEEAGIDKPLTPDDDDRKNLNNTKYRIQIIKVAHAIKEIIQGMKTEPVKVVLEENQSTKSVSEVSEDKISIKSAKPAEVNRNKLLSTAAVIVLLIIAGIFVYPKIFKRDTLERLRAAGERISVAVMPFQNMTNDTTWNIWQVGIQNELITNLTNSKELRVRQFEPVSNLIQSEGITNYALLTPSLARKISKKLDAKVMITGSIKEAGDKIRISAQLNDTKRNETYKSFQINGKQEGIINVTDSLSKIVRDFLVISKYDMDLGKLAADINYQISTNSPEALTNYIIGGNAPDNLAAIAWFRKAIVIDSSFVLPYLYIIRKYKEIGAIGYIAAYDSAKKWCLKIYNKIDHATPMQQLLIRAEFAFLFENQEEQNKYLIQLLNYDDQQPTTHLLLGKNYRDMREYDKAIQEFEKGVDIYEKWGVKPPTLSSFFDDMIRSYVRAGRYDEMKKPLYEWHKDFPKNNEINYWQAIRLFREGDSVKANSYVEEFLSNVKNYPTSKRSMLYYQIQIYSSGGMHSKVMEYCNKYLKSQTESMQELNEIAWTLLEDDRTLNEALAMAERSLALFPENMIGLHRKGWALYKLGKYDEALDLLQKSWDIRMKEGVYNHEAFLHLEAVKMAVANQKKN